jgi:hypothetical protein
VTWSFNGRGRTASRRSSGRASPSEPAETLLAGCSRSTPWARPLLEAVRKRHPDRRAVPEAARHRPGGPGATLDAFEIRDGYRYQAIAINSRRGQLAFLEARHRAHARVEDRIRTGKDTGLGHLPSRHENINAVWVELALIAADLLALSQSMLLTDEPDLHRAEPKTLRYRLLHTAARITHGQRKVFLRLAEHWPWAPALAQAFRRLRQIPLPA